jgi:hypothetical protein
MSSYGSLYMAINSRYTINNDNDIKKSGDLEHKIEERKKSHTKTATLCLSNVYNHQINHILK